MTGPPGNRTRRGPDEAECKRPKVVLTRTKCVQRLGTKLVFDRGNIIGIANEYTRLTGAFDVSTRPLRVCWPYFVSHENQTGQSFCNCNTRYYAVTVKIYTAVHAAALARTNRLQNNCASDNKIRNNNLFGQRSLKLSCVYCQRFTLCVAFE